MSKRTILVCDRCGKDIMELPWGYHDGSNSIVLEVGDRPTAEADYSREGIDLCNDCMARALKLVLKKISFGWADNAKLLVEFRDGTKQ